MVLKFKHIFFIILISLGFYQFYIEYKKLIKSDFILNKNQFSQEIFNNSEKIKPIINEVIDQNTFVQNKDELNKISIVISKGDTFLSILKKFDLTDEKIFQIINEIEKFYNLKKLKVNSNINFYKNTQENLKKIEIDLNIDTVLIVEIDDKISIKKQKLKKLLHQNSYEFKIVNSLYADGLKNGLPQDILIKLIKLFSFDLDFQRDILEGTIVSVSFDFNEIKNKNKIEYKDINYALISINNKKLEYFKFLTDDGYIDYFNREGKNVKKSILKTPLDGARISSNFGMRKHPISGYNKMHKGVDFAAPKGTPVYAGGNGIIEYVGNNGGYGKYIRIRHNNEYKTAYAHLSGFNKGISKGVRVNQGDIIGYVGSTGNSTGPHLHYEIIFQNKQINPLKLKLPSGKVLEGDELIRFKKKYKIIYANHLNLLYE